MNLNTISFALGRQGQYKCAKLSCQYKPSEETFIARRQDNEEKSENEETKDLCSIFNYYLPNV
jgi:hypothetical protein